MTRIRIDASSKSVELDVIYNYLTANVWSVASGDVTIFGTADGKWDFLRVASRMILTDKSGNQVGYLDKINLDTSLIGNPLGTLKVGDSGQGHADLMPEPGITWKVVAL
jgi:hypothetical protein